ncbi:MAG: adenylate/guanylate cyclase domain-containing protein [Gammaproteobacteria bacterium]|nr:MAG: adenylate/guanylate cyclase domain-containing protein [Gammaproteobacteria bacterium]
MLDRLKKLSFIKPSIKSIGLILTAFMLVFCYTGVDLLEVLELRTYDMRIKAKPKLRKVDKVVIAAIDEKSLKELGRWPWSRYTIARLVNKLDRLGANTIALDIVFAEPETTISLKYLRMAKNEIALSGDNALAKAFKKSNKVILSMPALQRNEARFFAGLDHKKVSSSVKKHAFKAIRYRHPGEIRVTTRTAYSMLINLPMLEDAARYTGHIAIYPDADGKMRRTPLVLSYKNWFIPSADIQTVRAYTKANNPTLYITANSVEGIQIGKRFIQTDELGNMLINYNGPEKTVPTYSVSDIMNNRIKKNALQNKIVLVGTTAKGIGDVRVTPYSAGYPGVEIRANIIDNLITGNYIYKPGWVILIDLSLILFFGVALSWLLPKFGLGLSIAITTLLLATHITMSFYTFNHYNLWFNLVYPVILILLLFINATVFKYFVTEMEKRRIKSAFKYYVPATIVEQVANNIEDLKLGGEKRELTVLFSDIRGFTAMSEKLGPEELVALLNHYLTKMTDVVFKYNGMLDKYIGDAIMAVYGAPVPRSDHASLACQTAIDMLIELKQLQLEWRNQQLPVMEIGIGINTGPMIVGNMGSNSKDLKKFNYTVIGDAVNLASRIEHLNKTYGSRILISEFTYQYTKDELRHVREIDVAQVRGRKAEVKLYEILVEDLYETLDWLPDFNEAYRLFRNDKLVQAKKIFKKLVKEQQDPVSHYYLDRCK